MARVATLLMFPIAVVMMLAPSGGASAQAPAPADSVAQALADSVAPDLEAPTPIVAVLPFANFTGWSGATDLLVPKIYQRLDATGFPYVSHEDVRPTLRRYRIRSRGRIGRDDAELLAQELGVRFLILGSLDIYRDEENPEVTVSLRIIDVRPMRVVKAASASATGEDFAGLFGIGRLTTIDQVADEVLDQLFKTLGTPLIGGRSKWRPEWPCSRVAIVTFDNMSETPYAGEVVTNILLSQLVNGEYFVLEPGFADQLFLAQQRVPRGGIGLPALESLRGQYDICLVITGIVDAFQPALGAVQQSAPEVSFGVRVLDAATGDPVAMYEEEMNGEDSESIFQLGRIYSLGKLTMRAMDEVGDEVFDLRKKQFSDRR